MLPYFYSGWLRCVGFLMGLCLVVLDCAATTMDPTPLRFGVFPRWNAQLMVREFAPLARILSQTLGRPVLIETDKDFATFMERVYAREFDLIHLNQLQYLRAHDRVGYRAVAKLCESSDCTMRAIIVTRTDTGIDRVSDLLTQRVAFGGQDAMVSHILARELLCQQGLLPSDYDTVFAKNPPNALLAVYNKAALAAGVGFGVLERPEITRRIDVNKLRVLLESSPIPTLPIAVRDDMSKDRVAALVSALGKLHAIPGGHTALARVGATHIMPAQHAEYTALQYLMAQHNNALP